MNDLIKHTDQLRDQLRANRGHFRAIAATSGITYHWLVSFSQGKIRNPTIKNVAALDAALKRHKPAA